MYVEEKHSICRVQDYQWFLASTGDLGTYPLWIRGDYCLLPFGDAWFLDMEA